MGKLFSSIFVMASIVFLTIGCDRNDNMGNGIPEGNGPGVPVNVKVGTSYRLEGGMNRIDVFLFEGDDNTDNAQKTLSYQVKAGNITFDQESGSGTFSFNAFPTKEGYTCDIVFIANCPQEVIQKINGASGTQKSVFLGALEAAIPQGAAFWTADMPMCGQLADIIIGDDGTLLSGEGEQRTSVLMYRSLARIDLYNQDPAHFTLTGVRVHNALERFRLVPELFHGSATELPDMRTPSLPDDPTIINRWYDNTDGSAEITGKFYYGEYENNGKAGEQLSFLLLKGNYTPDGGETMTDRYYRINFHDKGDILDILRNSLYTIRINNVIGPGYGSEDEAVEGVPVNISAEIETWHDYSLGNFQNGGQYTLKVSNSTVETGKSLSWQSIGIETTEPEGWKIYAGDNQALGNGAVIPDWIHLSTTEPDAENAGGMNPADISGPAGTMSSLYVITDAIEGNLPDGARFRTGSFHVQAGNLIKKITVTQRDQNLASMSVSPSPLEFGKTPSGFKEVTVSLEPSTVEYTLSVTEQSGDIVWEDGYGPEDLAQAPKNGVAVLRLRPAANESGKELKSMLSIVAKGPAGMGIESRAILEVIQKTTSNILTAEPLVLTSAAQQAKLAVTSDLPWKMTGYTDDAKYGPLFAGVLNRTEFSSGKTEYPFKVTENKTWKNRYISFEAGPASRDEDLEADIPEIRQEYPEPYIRLKNINDGDLRLILLDNEQGTAVNERIVIESNAPWKYPYGESLGEPLGLIGLEIPAGQVANEENRPAPAQKTVFDESLAFQPFGHPTGNSGEWYENIQIPSAGDRMTYTLGFETTLAESDITRDDRQDELPEPENAKVELEIQRIVPSLWKFSEMQIVDGSILDEEGTVMMDRKPFDVAVRANSNDSWTVSAEVGTSVISEGSFEKGPYASGETVISIPENPTWNHDGSKHYREIVITAEGKEFGEIRESKRTLKQSGYYLASMTADSLEWPGMPDTKQISVKASGDFDRIPLYLFELDKFGNRTETLAWNGEHYFDGTAMTGQSGTLSGEQVEDIPFRSKWGETRVGLYYKLPSSAGYRLLWKGWQPGYNMTVAKGPDFPDEVPAIGTETSIVLNGTWPEIYAKISGEYYNSTEIFAFKAGNGSESKKIKVEPTQAWDIDKEGRERKITIYSDRACTEAVTGIDFLQGTYSFKDCAWKDGQKPVLHPDGGTVGFTAKGIWPGIPAKCSNTSKEPYPGGDGFIYLQANQHETPAEAELSAEIPELHASVWDGKNGYGPAVDGRLTVYRPGGKIALATLDYTQETYRLTASLVDPELIPAAGGTLKLRLEGVWPALKYKIKDNDFHTPYEGDIPAGNSRDGEVVIEIRVKKTFNYFNKDRLLTLFCTESGYEQEFPFLQEKSEGFIFIPEDYPVITGFPEVLVDDEMQYLTKEEVQSNTALGVWELADRKCRERGMKLLTDEFEIQIHGYKFGDEPAILRRKLRMSGILGPLWMSLPENFYIYDKDGNRRGERIELSWNNWRKDGSVDGRLDPADPRYPMAPFYTVRDGYVDRNGNWAWDRDEEVRYVALRRENDGGFSDGYPEDCYIPFMSAGGPEYIMDDGPYGLDGIDTFMFRCVLEKKNVPAE